MEKSMVFAALNISSINYGLRVRLYDTIVMGTLAILIIIHYRQRGPAHVIITRLGCRLTFSSFSESHFSHNKHRHFNAAMFVQVLHFLS